MLCIITPVSPKQRFQVMLEPDQLAALRQIEEETGAAIGEQIRRAIDQMLRAKGVTVKSERKRVAARKRP
jgi:hypothetical protein